MKMTLKMLFLALVCGVIAVFVDVVAGLSLFAFTGAIVYANTMMRVKANPVFPVQQDEAKQVDGFDDGFWEVNKKIMKQQDEITEDLNNFPP